MPEPVHRADGTAFTASSVEAFATAGIRPTEAQRRYLSGGLRQAGGKLPLFDGEGQQVDRRTVESCVEKGWAARWFANPLKPDWIVCRLTPAGYRALGEFPPRPAA